MNIFKNNYKNKKVLITGHTGFKGSWLAEWLVMMGADVKGYSIDIPTTPSHFKVIELEKRISHKIGDICNLKELKESIRIFRPDFIFHLAAQPIVSISYKNPIATFQTNAIGTATLLEAIKGADYNLIALIITSDKCYENIECEWGYKESDRLGGKDPYSASKAMTEIVYHSYFHSFLKDSKIKSATVRAGNVVGGGDWAKDRIVVDSINAWSKNEVVEVRSPNATRPWQHVLEPLSGYLHLASELSFGDSYNGESFNFGPKSEQNKPVKTLLNDLKSYWKNSRGFKIAKNADFHEAGLLKLNCDKALSRLQWQPNLEYKETVAYTAKWYYEYYKNSNILTNSQIEDYVNLAIKRELIWTKPL